MNPSNHTTGPIQLSTSLVSRDMLDQNTATIALLDLGHDLWKPVSDRNVAVFLSLAERYGWEPTANFRSTDGHTLLEWLTAHVHGEPSLKPHKCWPTSLEAFWALDQDEEGPPLRNQDWLIALWALSGAPLWTNDHNGMGMPLVLYHCFLNQHTQALDLLMALPGAPRMEAMLHLSWWATEGNPHREAPTFLGWLVENKPNLLPHLVEAYPEVRLSAKQAAALPLAMVEQLTPWIPTGRNFQAEWLVALDERLYGGQAETFNPYQWLHARRPLLETPPTQEEEQRSLRQAVVDEALMFSHQKVAKNPWKMDLRYGDPGGFLLAAGNTHARLKGDIPVLAALLLKSLLHSKRREPWDNYVGGDLDATVDDPVAGTQKTLDGCLAPALEQSFGDGLPLRGLIALNLMEELDRYTSRGIDTGEAFLLGVSKIRDFVMGSLDEAMAVTLALIERFSLNEEEGDYDRVVVSLAKPWSTAMHAVRRSSTASDEAFFLFQGRDDLLLGWYRILRNWVGVWHRKGQDFSMNTNDPIGGLVNELMVFHRMTPTCPSFHGLEETDQELLLLKCLVGRDPRKFEAVIKAAQENVLSETSLAHLRKWLDHEEQWCDEYLPKYPSNGYPLAPENLKQCREALLHASLQATELNVKLARL